ncbi:hypothetical protein OK016_29385 [Vibrio chagasii]|nr:hypothetical protein [Vibrio chagasii]
MEDNAGAWITQKLVEELLLVTLQADDYLKANNSYDFFKQTGVLLTTGPTFDWQRRRLRLFNIDSLAAG